MFYCKPFLLIIPTVLLGFGLTDLQLNVSCYFRLIKLQQKEVVLVSTHTPLVLHNFRKSINYN